MTDRYIQRPRMAVVLFMAALARAAGQPVSADLYERELLAWLLSVRGVA